MRRLKKLTDFELAIIGSVVALVADINWLIFDILHAGRSDHLVTSLGLLVGVVILVFAQLKHMKTGKKPVQSNDDIDYRIKLYMQREHFKAHCLKEKQITHRRVK